MPACCLNSGNMVTMKYEAVPERQLSLAINEGPYVTVSEFCEPIADMPYLPFLNLGTTSSIDVRVHNGGSGRKRRHPGDSHHGVRMWLERQFTDAEIETATGSIPVHRAILCSSPHFKAALTGGFQESRECRLRIDDVSHGAVEAFLAFIYTGNLPDGANPAEVLKLAHRYDQEELVEICASAAVDAVCPTSVRGVVQVLRMLKENPAVAVAWQRLSDKIATGSELREALMMSI
mmetsp:Transcript_90769/g.252508  ORF Transcript_90769/g.252508 Transcript_90769/m.252508 type:complete len:234 (-) Transcript_90769:88-789(-)